MSTSDKDKERESPIIFHPEVLGPNFYQTIALNGSGRPHTIHGYEVNIHASEASAIISAPAGSSKIKVSTITNQTWELSGHRGNIVASNNHYLAYILEGRNGYVLRLIHQGNNSRALLKGFVGAIVDVGFAHANSNLLACVDQGGNLYLWDLDRVQDVAKIQTEALRVQIQTSGTAGPLPHRLAWCPYVPQEDEEEAEPTIAVSHGNQVDVFDLSVVFSNTSTGVTVPRTMLKEGIFTVDVAHEKPICDLALSPDGGVLATASEDGHLKFWQVNWEADQEPKCLHNFEPHNGIPVTRLMFCDNHTSKDESTQFWRFLITGASNNAEVKVWCTVSWKCLQTFRFLPPKNSPSDVPAPYMTMSLDLSSSYLLAADSRRMALYILQFYQDGFLGDASVTSVTEYLLTQPILSMVVSGHTPLPPPDGDSGDEVSDELPMMTKAFDSRRNVVLIKVHCIQTRSMQELLVRFEPPDLLGVPPEDFSLPGDELLKNLGQTEAQPKPQFQMDLPLSSISTGNGSFDGAVLVSPGGSALPKLATPSEFTSLAKPMPDLHTDITMTTTEAPPMTAPLLPALDPASSTLSSSLTLTSVSELKSRYAGSESPSEEPRLLKLLDVDSDAKERGTSSNELPLHPLHSLEFQQPPPRQETPETLEGLLLKSEAAVEGGEEGGEEEEGTTAADAAKESSDSSQASDGDANMTETQRTQKSMDSIFSTLQLENPHAPAKETREFNREGYAEFERLLTDPEGQKRILTSTEKSQFETERSEFVAPPTNQHARISETGSEIVNAAGNPTGYLEFLRQKTPSEGADEKRPRRDSEGGSPWPDIGGPDLQTVATKGTPPESEPRPVSDALLGASEEAPPPLVSLGQSAAREQGLRDLTTGEAITAPILREPRQELLELEVDEGGGDRRKTAEEGAAATGEMSRSDAAVSDAQDGAETIPALSTSQEPPTAELSSLAETGSTGSAGRVEPSMPPALEEVVGGAGGGVEGATGMAEQDVKEPVLELVEPHPLVPLAMPSEPEPLPVLEVSGRSQRRKRRSKGKQASAELLEIINHSDGETAAEPTVEPHVDLTLLTDLYQLVARQQQELQQLREEQQRSFQQLHQQLESVNVSTLEQQRSTLTDHARDQQQKLDRVLRDKQGLDKQRQDRLISSVSQTLTTAVNQKLDRVVKNEFKAQVIPIVNRSMSNIQEQVVTMVTQQIAAANSSLRESMGQLLQSRGLPEAVGVAVASSLQRTILTSYEEAFRSTVLPSFEKACQEMFRQVDVAFQRGTTDYMSQLGHQMQHHQDPALQQLAASVHSLTNPQGPLMAGIQACLQQESATSLQHMQQVVGETVALTVQREVEASLERHASKLNPEAKLQEDRKKKEEEIHKLLSSHDPNAAFELALSTSDLHLVMFLCQQVNLDEVFDKNPCPLSQPVLLSLIQQLSVDLNDRLELKIRYLEPSVLALDLQNEVTKSHMPPVLSGLSQQLSAVEKALQGNPGNVTLARRVKGLRMITERLCQPQTH